MTEACAVAAVVAAAGKSTRMGTPKQLLPWGRSTVIAAVVDKLVHAGASPVVVVTGHAAGAVGSALANTSAVIVHNRDYHRSEMLHSYQVGLQYLETERSGRRFLGAFLALADQPHISDQVLQALVTAAERNPDRIVVPSHNYRRGHPVFLPHSLWKEVIALRDTESTLREVFVRHSRLIQYVTVDTPTVLRDMDTPDDYEALKPRSTP